MGLQYLLCMCIDLAIERERTNQEKHKADQAKANRDIALASVKQKAREKGSARDTSSIHTPACAVAAEEASTTVLVDGVPASALSNDATQATKRYAGFFMSVVKASCWDVSFHPSPHPTTMKLLGPSNLVVSLAYTPSGTKNAYCALVEECASDPATFVQKFQNGDLIRDYHGEGFSTPSVLYKV